MSTTHNINIISITAYNLLAKVVFFVFMLGTGMYASRVLLQEQFGQAQYATWIVSIAWVFGNFGIPAMLHRNLAASYANKRYAEVRQLLHYSFWGKLLSIGLSAGVVYLLLLSERVSTQPILIVTLLCVQFLAIFFQFIMQGIFAYRQLFIGQSISTCIAFMYLWLALPEDGVEVYIYTYILYNSILLLALSFPIIKLFKEIHTSQVNIDTSAPFSRSKMLQLSAYFALSILLASVMWQRPEAYFIEKYLGYTQLSVYLIAFNLVFLATEPIRMLSSVLLSYFSGLSEQRAQLEKVYATYMLYLGWLGAFLGIFVYYYAPSIVKILYTETYIESALLLRIFVPFFMISAINQVSVNLLIGLKKIRQLLYFDVANFILFSLMLLWVLPAANLSQITWGKGIIHLWSVAYICVVVYRLGFYSPLRNLLKNVLLAFGCVFTFYSFFPDDGLLWQLMLAGIFSFLIYASFSIRFGLIDRQVIVKIINRLLGKND